MDERTSQGLEIMTTFSPRLFFILNWLQLLLLWFCVPATGRERQIGVVPRGDTDSIIREPGPVADRVVRNWHKSRTLAYT